MHISPRPYDVMCAKIRDKDSTVERECATRLALGPGLTVWVGEDVLMMAGLVIFKSAPWIGEYWILGSTLMDKLPVLTMKALRTITPHYTSVFFQEYPDLKRIQAAIRADFIQSAKMSQLLGMKFEGVLRGYYADGVDAIMLSIVR